jgi:hypothetical protein
MKLPPLRRSVAIDRVIPDEARLLLWASPDAASELRHLGAIEEDEDVPYYYLLRVNRMRNLDEVIAYIEQEYGRVEVEREEGEENGGGAGAVVPGGRTLAELIADELIRRGVRVET